ncbi:GGDEF domain-containing protein [Methylotenera sp.]|uniref:GGDEF domain-containing protein n=1 Tax=Methylotenera sp. TaxID=2051956 RepID=UPI002EDB1D00
MSKLVTLTKERDDLSLQVALIKTLTDFINFNHNESKRIVVIYHVSDLKKQSITALAEDSSSSSVDMPADFKRAILNCLHTGNPHTYRVDAQRAIKLHPITGTMGHVDSVIAIDADHTNEHLYNSVCMILDIYQNFILLNNENECDTLTGLLNRKTFDFKINKILAQMHSGSNRKEDKTNQKYFLAIFDIDHFKKINDQFGHLIGDEVLLMFSQLMRQSFREADPLFRFGGEEFVGFFECSSTVDIQNIFERFKQKVANFEFPQVGKVSVSAGFTEISTFDTSSQIIDRADTALYYAKNNGRNRVDSYELLIANGSLQENKKEGEIELF